MNFLKQGIILTLYFQTLWFWKPRWGRSCIVY